jgi:hypothetical protein
MEAKMTIGPAIPRVCERCDCDRLARWELKTRTQTVYFCEPCKVLLDHFLVTFGNLNGSELESTRLDVPRVVAEYDIRNQRWRR